MTSWLRESHLLANAEQLRTAAAEGYDLLYEADHSAQEILKRVARSLEPLADSVPELSGAVATLERLADETREVAYSLRDLGQSWEDNPARLEDIEARLALYRRLAARFHCTADELAARRVETEAKLAAIERDEDDLEHLDAPLAEAFQALKSGRGRALDRAAEDSPGLRPGHPVAAQTAGPGESPANGRGRDPRPGRRPDGSLAPRIGTDCVEMLFSPTRARTPRPLAEDRLGWRAVPGHAGGQDGARLHRSGPDAGSRRDRYGSRRPAGRGPGQDTGRAGAAPPGHLRHPPAPDC